MHNHRHSLECILPEHMLEQIATKGSDAQKQMAMDNISVVYQLRAERAMRASLADLFAPTMPRAAEGGKERIVYDVKRGTKHDFRCEVRHLALNHPGFSHLLGAVARKGKAKVDQLGDAALSEQHIMWRNVAMHDGGNVGKLIAMFVRRR